MTIEGAETLLTIDTAYPYAFSPDSQYLLYAARPERAVAGLYSLKLGPSPTSKPLTNVGVSASLNAPPAHFIELPLTQHISWADLNASYDVEGGTVTVNVETGDIRETP